jgi:hypothetical protein
MNDLVPSIGSSIQRKPLAPVDSPSSSPTIASLGKPVGDPFAHQPFGLPVRDRDRGIVRLSFDVQLFPLEVGQRGAPG